MKHEAGAPTDLARLHALNLIPTRHSFVRQPGGPCCVSCLHGPRSAERVAEVAHNRRDLLRSGRSEAEAEATGGAAVRTTVGRREGCDAVCEGVYGRGTRMGKGREGGGDLFQRTVQLVDAPRLPARGQRGRDTARRWRWSHYPPPERTAAAQAARDGEGAGGARGARGGGRDACARSASACASACAPCAAIASRSRRSSPRTCAPASEQGGGPASEQGGGPASEQGGGPASGRGRAGVGAEARGPDQRCHFVAAGEVCAAAVRACTVCSRL
jgi:hypothetical protein